MKLWLALLPLLLAYGLAGQALASPVSEKCRLLAATPLEDGQLGGPGVSRTGIILSRNAVPACKAALAELPDDPVTQYRFARALWAPGVLKDDRLALYWAATAAKQGYPVAQYGLGLAFLYGYNVQPDEALGLDWLRRAADQQFPPALNELAEIYFFGTSHAGFKPDWALKYYEGAAAAGWIEAKYRAGRMLLLGETVPRDEAKAKTLFLEAAEAGHAESQWQVGSLLLTDDSADKAQALEWLQKAADQKLPVAINDLGYAYSMGIGVKQDDAKAIVYYRQAAELGDVIGQHSLAHFLFMGRGGPRDPEASVEWMKKAALQDIYVQSQYWLAIYYSEGWGTPVDMVEAEHWFRQAARNGEPECMQLVADLDNPGVNHEEVIVGWLAKLLDKDILAIGNSPTPPLEL